MDINYTILFIVIIIAVLLFAYKQNEYYNSKYNSNQNRNTIDSFRCRGCNPYNRVCDKFSAFFPS